MIKVRDGHDRYANTETGLLLQHIENHKRLVILATNMRTNIDDAFMRRVHYIVEFPAPAT
jgi:SpoVK/Ycf46/Vps4 family AAA+-type ATPase